MVENYKITIDKFVADTEEKLLIVMRESIRDIVHYSQTPVFKGGKMRVKTGFLRSSGVPSLNAIPTGPTVKQEGKTYNWSTNSLDAVLARMKLGDTFYFGWSANYARYREARDGFMLSAILKFQFFVNESVRKFK